MKSLQEIFEKYRNHDLFIDSDNNCIKYCDILKIVENRNFKSIDRKLVFCLIDNSVGGISGYLSILIANGVPQLINKNINEKQFRHLINTYQPSFILISSSSKLKNIINLKFIYSFDDLVLYEIRGNTEYNINKDLSLLLSTSGSTGSSKYVRISNKNIISNATSISEYLKLNHEEIPITTLPPNYSYGLSVIHSHIIAGAKIAVTNNSLIRKEFWDFFKKVKSTSISGVPFTYEMLSKIGFLKEKYDNLKTLTQAGGKLDMKLKKVFAEYCEKNGINLYIMYGQTEATARISYLPIENLNSKMGSIGVAIPNGKLWIEDEKHLPINKSDKIGELCYQGDNVSLGYAENYEDLKDGNSLNNVLRTGDLAKYDEDRFYYIVGRKKRIVKINGNRVNLDEVESQLSNNYNNIVCAGIDDCIRIYSRSKSMDEAKNIRSQISEFLSVLKKYIEIYSINEIPRNNSGKILYSKLDKENSKKIL